MYGRIFESLYSGSMVGKGSAMFAVWGYVIAKMKPDKTVGAQVELNPKLLGFILGEPHTVIEKVINELCEPDPESTCKDEEGRRLIRLGEYAYRVVSAPKYLAIRNEQERREYHRVRRQRERQAKKDNTPQPLQPTNAYPAVESSTEPGRAVSETPANNGDCVAEFDQFWAAYPKKRNFIEAQRAFVESKAKGHIRDILEALKWQKRTDDWLKEGGKFIPSPVTYLSDRRWQEENMELKALMPRPECESIEQREIRLAQEFAMLKQAPLTPEERLRRTKQPPR